MGWGLTDHMLGTQPKGPASSIPPGLWAAPPSSGALPEVALWGLPGNKFPGKKL